MVITVPDSILKGITPVATQITNRDPAMTKRARTFFTLIAAIGLFGASLSPVIADETTRTSLSTDFITEWTIPSGGATVTLPFYGTEVFAFTVDWCSGATASCEENYISSTAQKKLAAGTHTIRIWGDKLPPFNFSKIADGPKRTESRSLITDIKQWGNVKLGNEGDYFGNCPNLNVTATDSPDLSAKTGTTYLYRMFGEGEKFNGNISHWETQDVTSMADMFGGAYLFNQDLSSWKTSNVTNMKYMFARTAFNYPLITNGDVWNTSKVTSMRGMLASAKAFNQNIGSWDTSNVTDMYQMFDGAEAFNQNIGNWNTSEVTDMYETFGGAKAFNQNIGNWNTGNVENMNRMFFGATAFNQDISGWNISEIAAEEECCSGDSEKFAKMGHMFYGASSFNQDLSEWNLTPKDANQPPGFDSGTTSWTKSKPQFKDSKKVTFNGNGASGSATNQFSISSAALTANTFTRAGYDFASWNTIALGGGTTFANNAPSYPFTASETLYAQWTSLPNKTVIFDANGGSGTMADQVRNVATALTANTFTRAGYSFTGWNTTAAGDGTTYANNASYPFTASETLYAQWTRDPTPTPAPGPTPAPAPVPTPTLTPEVVVDAKPLTPREFAGLSPAQVATLTPAVVASLPVDVIAVISPAQSAALQPASVQALTTTQLEAMTPAAVGGLNPIAICTPRGEKCVLGENGLTATQLAAFTPAAFANLTAVQATVIRSEQVGELSAEQVKELSPAAVRALAPTTLGALTPSQINALRPARTRVLRPEAVAELSPVQSAAMRPASLRAIRPAAIAQMQPESLAALTPRQLRRMTPRQVDALRPAPIRAMSPRQQQILGL
jgi:uncharacterized repeat protein (TIGR02543 family)